MQTKALSCRRSVEQKDSLLQISRALPLSRWRALLEILLWKREKFSVSEHRRVFIFAPVKSVQTSYQILALRNSRSSAALFPQLGLDRFGKSSEDLAHEQ